MKNKKTSMLGIFSGLAVVLAIGFASCAKDGEVGPKGDKGDTGAQGAPGAQGPAGATGAPGAPGTANVIYSAWTDVTYSTVDQNQDGTADFYGAQINAPKLVDSILQKGEIKVYFNFGSATQPEIVSLPYATAIIPVYTLNKIILQANDDYSTVTENGVKYGQYRYVLIPGAVLGRSSVNWNDYAQVKKYLSLKD